MFLFLKRYLDLCVASSLYGHQKNSIVSWKIFDRVAFGEVGIELCGIRFVKKENERASDEE